MLKCHHLKGVPKLLTAGVSVSLDLYLEFLGPQRQTIRKTTVFMTHATAPTTTVPLTNVVPMFVITSCQLIHIMILSWLNLGVSPGRGIIS